MGGHTARLFVCRVSWSRSAMIYMAVNPRTDKHRRLLRARNPYPKLIELRLTFTTFQCCKIAKVVWARRVPRQICRRELGPVGTLTGDQAHTLWTSAASIALSSSHRTCACHTTRATGFYALDPVGFLPFFWSKRSTHYLQSLSA